MDKLIKKYNKNLYLYTDIKPQYLEKYKDEKENLFYQIFDNNLFYEIEYNEYKTINIDELKKYFDIIQVEQDGACLFSCISYGLDLNIDGKQFKKYLYEKYHDSNIMFEHFKGILESKTLWGDNDIISWFVNIFNICIYIYMYLDKNNLIKIFKYGNEKDKRIHLKLENNHFNILKPKKEIYENKTNLNQCKNKIEYIEEKLSALKKNKLNLIIFKNIFTDNSKLLEKTFSNIFNENINNKFHNLILYSKQDNLYKHNFLDISILKKHDYFDPNILETINLFTCNLLKNKDIKINVLSVKKDLYIRDMLDKNHNDNNLMYLKKETLTNFIDYNTEEKFNIVDILNKKHDNYFLENIIIRYKYENKIFNIIYIYQNKDLKTQIKNNLLLKILKNSLEDVENIDNDNTNIIYITPNPKNILEDINFNFFKQNNLIEENKINNVNFLEENDHILPSKKLKIDEDFKTNIEYYIKNKKIDEYLEKIEKHNFIIEDEQSYNLKDTFVDNFLEINCEETYENNSEKTYENSLEELPDDSLQEIPELNFEDSKDKKKETNKPSYMYHNNELYILKFNKYYVKASNNFFNLNY